jgi:hypothetical protein
MTTARPATGNEPRHPPAELRFVCCNALSAGASHPEDKSDALLNLAQK